MFLCCHPHRVPCAVRRGAFPPCDAESQPLVITDEAGGEPLPRPAGTVLQVEGEAAAPPLPWEVVVLGPQRRGGDGVLRFHHALPQYCHGDRRAGAAESFHCRVMLGFVEVHSIDLRQPDLLLLNMKRRPSPSVSHTDMQMFTSSSLSPTLTPALAAGPSSDTLEMKIP